jgi:hypothetical protein
VCKKKRRGGEKEIAPNKKQKEGTSGKKLVTKYQTQTALRRAAGTTYARQSNTPKLVKQYLDHFATSGFKYLYICLFVPKYTLTLRNITRNLDIKGSTKSTKRTKSRKGRPSQNIQKKMWI